MKHYARIFGIKVHVSKALVRPDVGGLLRAVKSIHFLD